jgi:hypothetical protein
MRRVGLIDITVGNACASAHRNVPPRDAARRTTSLRNARAAGDTRRLSRFNADGHPLLHERTNFLARKDQLCLLHERTNFAASWPYREEKANAKVNRRSAVALPLVPPV